MDVDLRCRDAVGRVRVGGFRDARVYRIRNGKGPIVCHVIGAFTRLPPHR